MHIDVVLHPAEIATILPARNLTNTTCVVFDVLRATSSMVTAQRLREFSAEYFGPFGGYAQQYLFHHARKTWPRGRGKG